MSVNYIDKSTGDLIRVAGQGKAEYGASTERKGDIVVPATTAGNFQSVSVVFAQAMPDNDYAVVIDEGGETWAHGATNVTNKTATGFTLFFFNAAGSDAPQMTFKYRAFKLYTDTEYNNLLNNAVLTSDVTDAVTNGDMNPVTSNAVYDALSAFAKTISLQPLNNSTIDYDKSRIIGGVVTVCADIIVQSGSYLVKENAVANIPNSGTASIGYILPCLYRNTGNGVEEPGYVVVNPYGNLHPYYTKTEYNEIRINASYASKVQI